MTPDYSYYDEASGMYGVGSELYVDKNTRVEVSLEHESKLGKDHCGIDGVCYGDNQVWIRGRWYPFR